MPKGYFNVPINLHQKQAIVAEVRDLVINASTIVVSENLGVKSNDMNLLRAQGRRNNTPVRVVRNTLMHRAISGTNMECISSSLNGTLVFVFSIGEYSTAAQLVQNFAKNNSNLVPKAIAIEGQVLLPEHLGRIAKLPTLDTMRTNLLTVLQAPVTRLLRVLNEPAASFVRILQAHADQSKATNHSE